MLEELFGNKSIEKVLLFLFVSEESYPFQIQKLLGLPLLTLQKAFLRLEKEGVILSRLAGKFRRYQLNSSYPFQEEPDQDQKKKKELLDFWDKLLRVKALSIQAQTKRGGEIVQRIGQAEVEVELISSHALIFRERGHWLQEETLSTGFTSSVRWTRDENASFITLEHLRYGIDHPVFLLHFTSTAPFVLESADAHLCAADTYVGSLSWKVDSIDLRWRIIGPIKNEQLLYHYQVSL